MRIEQPAPNQLFCATEPFKIPVIATIPPDECQDVTIDWVVTIGGKNYTTSTTPGQQGFIDVLEPPMQDSDFGSVKVRASAKVNSTGTQEFSGTGRVFGSRALQLTVRESGQNFEGYILDNCDDDEQDMVIGEPTNNFQPGATYSISGYCTDAVKDIPSSGAIFSAPWTSESSSHWAYWERQAIVYANQHAFDDTTKLVAIWYISDRSGFYNEILDGIAYPPNGPTKNFSVDVTPPSVPLVVDDGDTTRNHTQLHATWTSQEFESGIVEYLYAIGTSPGATDVVDWTSSGGVPEVTHKGLDLTEGLYYFAVKAINGAGLVSEAGFSDGIYAKLAGFSDETVYNFPNPFSPDSDGFTNITFILEEAENVVINIFDASGELVWKEELTANPGKNLTRWDGKNLMGETAANGVYFCRVEIEGTSVIKKIAVLQ